MKKTIKFYFFLVSAIRRGSMKGYPACLSIFHFSYFPTFQTELFLLREALFLRLKAFFLRLEFSRGTTIAAVIGQAVVDLKLEVKWELILTHYHCHSRGSITRSDVMVLRSKIESIFKYWTFFKPRVGNLLVTNTRLFLIKWKFISYVFLRNCKNLKILISALSETTFFFKKSHDVQALKNCVLKKA